MQKIKSLFISLVLVTGLFGSNAIAIDLNTPNFTGTVNTTISSGLSIRTSERNCLLQDGMQYSGTVTQFGAASGGDYDTEAELLANAYAASASGTAPTSISTYLSGGTKNYQYSDTCARFQTDAYGNTSTNAVEFGNVNADNGNLNFDKYDIIDATQKAFTEISGTHSSGVGVNLSFIANYNPVLEFSDPDYMALTTKAEEELESDVQILDAYMTGSFDVGDNFVDVTVGRYVTSLGEATFIPVGMNGLVTNALDLTKLRAPGASIRDALMPTEQITLSTQAGGWGISAYYQFNESHIQLDPKGSFFGSDVVGTGGDYILASGANVNEAYEEWCPAKAVFENIDGVNSATPCSAELVAAHSNVNAGAARAPYETGVLYQRAFDNASSDKWQTYISSAAAAIDGASATARSGGATTFITGGLTTAGYTSNGTAADQVWAASNIDPWAYDAHATVRISAAANKHSYARDDGQWGVSLNRYIDNIGTGVDVGLYYSNYHSKVPYIQYVGKGGMLAGDIVGAYTNVLGAFVTAAGTLRATRNAGQTAAQKIVNNITNRASDYFIGYNSATTANTDTINKDVFFAGLNGAFGSGICGGVGASSLSTTYFSSATSTETEKKIFQNIFNRELINGRLVHDPASCINNTNVGGGVDLLYLTFTPSLAAAVTPLNYAKYRFIYPEDNQIFGASFNTNIRGTTVQGEVSYRPDFPLSTASGDQINQIGDASGVTTALSLAGYSLAQLTSTGVTNMGTMKTVVDNVLGTGQFDNLLLTAKRSSLPTITSTGSAGNDYYSTAFIEEDVFSWDLGTTTSFTASHPITRGLGADSAVFLTEFAGVHITNHDNKAEGFIARNGFNEGGGEFLCLGMYQNLTSAQTTAINTALTAAGSELQVGYNLANGSITSLGASIVDAVFGNGSYCEDQMGADSDSYTSRFVGSATYNNFANTPWSLSPRFSIAYDFMGYGPSSLGGFVEDRISMSVGAAMQRGDTVIDLSYVDQMGDEEANLRNDMDFLSFSVSHSF